MVYKGKKRIILNQSSRTDRKYVHVPDLAWEDGETSLGTKQRYGSGTIESENEVKISFNDRVLAAIKPRTLDEDEERDQREGAKSLNLKQLIDFQDGRPGVYTIQVTSTLSYRTCEIVQNLSSYSKNTDTREKQQTLTLTIEVK